MSMSTDDIKNSLSIADMLLNDASEEDVMDNLTGSTMDDDADKIKWDLEHDNFLKSLLELENNNSEFKLFTDKDEIMSSAATTSRFYDNAESSSCSVSGHSSVDIKPFIPPSESSKSDDAVIEMDFIDAFVREEIVNVNVYDENDNDNGDTNSMAMKPTFIQQPQVLKSPPRTVVITPKQSKGKSSISKQLSKPVFIPIDLSNVKTIKVVNKNGKTINAKVFKQLLPINDERRIFVKNNGYMVSKSMPILEQNKVVSDSSTSDDSKNSFYPRLHLTNEEKILLEKEGVKLPSHYPLTNHEEQDLNRIRRKIKNKISAQDSRNRKKEYVNKLEEKVKLYYDENSQLINNVCALQTENELLKTALKRLQNANTPVGTTTQPAMCLLILMASLALIAASNLRRTVTDEKDIMSIEGQKSNIVVPGRSRNLLFSGSGSSLSTTNLKDMLNMVTKGLSADVQKDTIMVELSELLDFNGLARNKDPDDSTTLMEDYYVPEWDDDWTKTVKRSASSEWADELIIPFMKRKRETEKN